MRYIRPVIFVCVCAAFMAVSGSAFAKVRVFDVVFPIPEVDEKTIGANPGMSKDALIVSRSRAISKELAARLKKRLAAAKIKDYHVEVKNFKVEVTIGGHEADEAELTDLLNHPNHVEIRPILKESGRDWEKIKPILPAYVKVFQTTTYTYLWSTNLPILTSILKDASMLSSDTVPVNGRPAKKRLIAGPVVRQKSNVLGGKNEVSGGWRSYMLGEVIGSNRSIAKSSWAMNSVGGYSTTVVLSTPVSVPVNVSDLIAVVIDDEVVAILPSEKVKGEFKLEAPSEMSKQQQRVWSQAMAGRFASEIVIPFAIARPKKEVVK